MPYSTEAKNRMLNYLATQATFRSLHTGNPGDTGANELAGGSPAYARKPVAFNAAASGTMDDSNQPVFDVPGGVTVTFEGFWDHATLTGATHFLGYGAITSETFGSQGTYTATDADLDLNN